MDTKLKFFFSNEIINFFKKVYGTDTKLKDDEFVRHL